MDDKKMSRKWLLVLIETQWNVKFSDREIQNGCRGSVLIETQWNVKTNSGALVGLGTKVLIETQWNVKWLGDHLDTVKDFLF